MEQLLQLQSSLDSFQIIQGGTGNYAVSNPKIDRNIIQIGNSIKELNMIHEHDSNIEIGSAVKLARLEEFFQTIIKKSEENAPVFNLGKVFINALSSLASAQIRNIASIGGSVMWRHPSSDLMVLYILLGCQLRVRGSDGVVKDIVIDESFHKSKSEDLLSNGSIILSLIIPKPSSEHFIGFYKKSKRKEFALSIVNLGIILKQDAKRAGNFTNVKIVIGGTENPGKIEPHCYHKIGHNVMKEIMDVKGVSMPNLIEAINKDLPINVEYKKLGVYRQGLAVSFIKHFLNALVKPKTEEVMEEKFERTSTQAYQKVKNDQPNYDDVERPIPHNCSAEQGYFH